MIDREQLINEVFEQHRISIDKDDPILGLVALNEIILKQYRQNFEKSLNSILSHSREEILTNLNDAIEARLGAVVYGIEQVLNQKIKVLNGAIETNQGLVSKLQKSLLLIQYMFATMIFAISIVALILL